MPKLWTHRKACRLCNSRNVIPVLKYTFTPPDTALTRPNEQPESNEKIPLIVSICEKCRLVQMLDVIDPRILFTRYPHARFTTPDSSSHCDAYAQEAITRGHIHKGDLVVDIGCGNGALLRAFRKHGIKVIGIDPSSHAVEQAKIDGHTVYAEMFSPELAGRILKQHGPASLVTANHVLGSIDNLFAVIAGVRHLLKPEGLFYFEEYYLADIMEQNQFDVFHHERLTWLTAIPFEPFLRGTMMHLIDARRIPGHKDIFRAVAQRNDGPHVVNNSLKEFMDTEQRNNLHTIERLNEFAARVESLKCDLKSMVHDMTLQGKHIAGYGASGRTVTFLHECEWLTDAVEYIADDNPIKHGLQVPGTHVQVVHPDTIRGKRPDFLLIFAHHYANQIMGRYEDFHRAGGRFIIPFPTPKIV